MSNDLQDLTPKVFISYSWSSTEHEERVIFLCEKLMNNGIEVILDKWELKEGQDKFAFMEKSVNDELISNVLVICDKQYKEKANERKGGVGTETTIISGEIYNQVGQTKFIPVIFEKDDEGKAYLPTYMASRIYIDLSNEEGYEKEYDKLIRNLWHKPIYGKPILGNKPSYLDEDNVDNNELKTILNQIKNLKNPKNLVFFNEKYRNTFIKNMLAYDFKSFEECSAEAIEENISKMQPLRNYYIDYLETILMQDENIGNTIAIFFEKVYNGMIDGFPRDSSYIVAMASYYGHGGFPRKGSDYATIGLDHFRFLIWEMFLYTMALLYYYHKYDDIKKITKRTYFLSEERSVYNNIKNFSRFCPDFNRINAQLNEIHKTNCLCYLADKLLKRESLPIFKKEYIVEIDILLCQLHMIYYKFDIQSSYYWFPFIYGYHNKFTKISFWEMLVSKQYCENVLNLYDAKNLEDFRNIVKEYNYGNWQGFKYQNVFHNPPSIASTIKVEDIGTLP